MVSEPFFWWLFAASVALLLLSPLVVAWAVVRLPPDYFFVSRRRGHAPWQQTHPVLRLVVLVAKNAPGYVLLLAGLAMLFLPGQGLLTIVVGLALMDFPGKFRPPPPVGDAQGSMAIDQLAPPSGRPAAA